MITLLLLPGMDGTGQLFAPLIAALPAEFRVKVVSYPANKALGYAELEALVRAEVPDHGPYAILGESFSGPIAVSLAAATSQRLLGLILCCTFVRNPHPVLSGLRSLVGLMPVSFAPIVLMRHMLLGRFSTKVLCTALVNSLAQVSPLALHARIRAALEVDVADKMSMVQVPVLYLRAAHDRVVPKGASELVLRCNPRVQCVELDAPHFLLQTVPAEAAKVIAHFIHTLHKTR